jgi:hypothetical protein
MIRATGAKLRMLASEAVALLFVFLGVVCGGEVEECGEADDMAGYCCCCCSCRASVAQVRGGAEWLAGIQEAADRRRGDSSVRLEGR